MPIDIPKEDCSLDSENEHMAFTGSDAEHMGLQLVRIFHRLSPQDQDKVLSFASDLRGELSPKP
jgi:hypothetical protein